MNINELSLSVPATVGRPLSCRAGADQLLTSDINPSVVTRTFMFFKEAFRSTFTFQAVHRGRIYTQKGCFRRRNSEYSWPYMGYRNPSWIITWSWLISCLHLCVYIGFFGSACSWHEWMSFKHWLFGVLVRKQQLWTKRIKNKGDSGRFPEGKITCHPAADQWFADRNSRQFQVSGYSHLLWAGPRDEHQLHPSWRWRSRECTSSSSS